MYVLEHVCEGQKTTFSNQFSPCRFHIDKNQTQLCRLDSKYLYPLCLLVTPEILLFLCVYYEFSLLFFFGFLRWKPGIEMICFTIISREWYRIPSNFFHILFFLMVVFFFSSKYFKPLLNFLFEHVLRSSLILQIFKTLSALILPFFSSLNPLFN